MTTIHLIQFEKPFVRQVQASEKSCNEFGARMTSEVKEKKKQKQKTLASMCCCASRTCHDEACVARHSLHSAPACVLLTSLSSAKGNEWQLH